MRAVRPIAGAVKNGARPKTVLEADGAWLVVDVPGERLRLRPAALALYSCPLPDDKAAAGRPGPVASTSGTTAPGSPGRLASTDTADSPGHLASTDGANADAVPPGSPGHFVSTGGRLVMPGSHGSGSRDPDRILGLVALDPDGLVMLDLPGEWLPRQVAELATALGIPLTVQITAPAAAVRLAARAPGWRRLHGRRVLRLGRWTKPVLTTVAFTGLLVMAYLVTAGGWLAWRGLSGLGRMLLDLLDSKLAIAAFAPLALLARPIRARFHRRRLARGTRLGPLGGPYLRMIGTTLELEYPKTSIPMGGAATLVHYRYEELAGLLILNRTGAPLHHLPGPLTPDAVHRFATRNSLDARFLRFTRAEYLSAVHATRRATP
ncbi:hypothetical protein [Nonomuraea sp. NPDC050310]|uniref:hypothetical protein n=1 Tax=Nonomuraea sp. NPDC050310 TaxID=3154935 RepID=UPI0033CBA10D